MGMLFGPKPGVWWIESKKDPRWKAEGRVEAISVSGGPPQAAKDAVARLTALHGQPPDDLEYGCMKD